MVGLAANRLGVTGYSMVPDQTIPQWPRFRARLEAQHGVDPHSSNTSAPPHDAVLRPGRSSWCPLQLTRGPEFTNRWLLPGVCVARTSPPHTRCPLSTWLLLHSSAGAPESETHIWTGTEHKQQYAPSPGRQVPIKPQLQQSGARAWRCSRLLNGYRSTRVRARRSTPLACTLASAGSLPPPISAANSSVT